VLDVRQVTKSFDGFQAVGGVSFTVPKGSISAIIGPNGAGKTTLFNLITGHLPPDSGRVIFKERDVTGIAPHDLCRLGRGWNLFTPVERLYRTETEALLEAVGLHDKAQETSGFLSHGNQKQLELGITLALEPEILLLDEPTAGMSAAETRDSIRLIERIAADRGLTLLFTEHDMAVVFSIAHRITVLHQGRVIADGPPAEVRRDPDVQRVYLGESR